MNVVTKIVAYFSVIRQLFDRSSETCLCYCYCNRCVSYQICIIIESVFTQPSSRWEWIIYVVFKLNSQLFSICILLSVKQIPFSFKKGSVPFLCIYFYPLIVLKLDLTMFLKAIFVVYFVKIQSKCYSIENK